MSQCIEMSAGCSQEHRFSSDVSKRQWPDIRYGEKRAIRFDEHFSIVELWPNPERRRFYEPLWHIGGAQTDVASYLG